jgi:hypothetical protein
MLPRRMYSPCPPIVVTLDKSSGNNNFAPPARTMVTVGDDARMHGSSHRNCLDGGDTIFGSSGISLDFFRGESRDVVACEGPIDR